MSNVLMFHFHYDYIKTRYGNTIKENNMVPKVYFKSRWITGPWLYTRDMLV